MTEAELSFSLSLSACRCVRKRSSIWSRQAAQGGKGSSNDLVTEKMWEKRVICFTRACESREEDEKAGEEEEEEERKTRLVKKKRGEGERK